MTSKKKSFKITEEQQIAMEKAARRAVELESGNRYSPTVVHKTHKKDKKRDNDVKDFEQE